MQSDNLEVVRRYAAALSAGDWNVMRELFATDATIVGVFGSFPFEEALGVWEELHSAFELKLEIQALIADEKQVAARYIETGKFVAPFRGHEPTGRTYELVAMEWFEFRDGRIVRRWGARDSASQNRQLGI